MMRISTAMILATLAIAPASVAAQTTPAAPGRTPTPAPAQAPPQPYPPQRVSAASPKAYSLSTPSISSK